MKLAERWDRYWFRPAPLFDLAVLRVLVVGYQVLWLGTTDVAGRIE